MFNPVLIPALGKFKEREMIPDCQTCKVPMTLKERVMSNKPYRIRRFECKVCGNQETIFGTGNRDLLTDPEAAIKAVQRGFKQEEDNNDFLTFQL